MGKGPWYCPASSEHCATVSSSAVPEAWEACTLHGSQCSPCLQPQGYAGKGGILVVGDAPGRWEDSKGEPFTGQDGNELRSALKTAGIDITKVTFTYAARCCPSRKKIPVKALNYCANTYLFPLIEHLEPSVIVPVGAVALKALLRGKKVSIMKLAGLEYQHGIAELPAMVAVVSPGFVRRNTRANRPAFLASFRKVKAVYDRVALGIQNTQVAVKKSVWYPTKLSDFDEAEARLQALAAGLKFGDYVSYDVETTGLDPWAAGAHVPTPGVLCLSLSTDSTSALVTPFSHPQTPPWGATKAQRLSDLCKGILQRPEVVKVAHNMKFDNKWLRRCLGWAPTALQKIGDLPGAIDTMLAHAMVAPADPHSLDALVMRYCDHVYGNYWAHIKDAARVAATQSRRGQKRAMTAAEKRAQEEGCLDYGLVPLTELCQYNGYDTMAPLWLLHNLLLAELHRSGTFETFRDLVMPGSFSLQRMEESGIAVDTTELLAQSIKYEMDIANEKTKFYAMSFVKSFENSFLKGKRMNMASHVQKSALLYKHLGLAPSIMTDGGNGSVGKEAIKILQTENYPPEVKALLDSMTEVGKLEKCHGTFLKPVSSWRGTDGFVHTVYNLHKARTGRLSSTRPNLQNQPKKIRPIYMSRFPDGLILNADFSQIESRVLACFCQDPALLRIFREGRDFHIMNAGLMLGKDPGAAIKSGPNADWGEVTPDDRQYGKQAVTFGLSYGRTGKALAADLQIPEAEGIALRKRYFDSVPMLPKWIECVYAHAKKVGYVRTATGRIRYLPDLWANEYHLISEAERQAVNTCIQGTASDMTLRALIVIEQTLREWGFQAVPVVTVHDSIGIDTPRNEAQAVGELMLAVMQDVSMYPWVIVPFDVELTANRQWDK